MKILITGANGMVARAAAEHCRMIGDDVAAFDRASLDISRLDDCRRAFEAFRPDAVLNCAAYTNVDGAESDAEQCYMANSLGPENLAVACGEADAVLVTISTDYVFSGEYEGFYTQHFTPFPRGVYARSKFDGEVRVRNANARSIIVRSGWIYGFGGTNFLSLMPDLLASGKSITAIADSYGTPTFAGDLAVRLRELAELDLPAVFHVTNSGSGTSYLGFAQEVCRVGGFDPEMVTSVSKDDLQRPAPRPASSKLACLFSERFGLSPLRDWREALAEFIK